MPIRDHFQPPDGDRLPWSSLLAGWSTRVADELVARMPDEFCVEQSIKPAVPWTVDVEVTDGSESVPPWRSAWQPPAADGVSPAFFADRCEVQVFRQFGDQQLVAEIDFVRPENKGTETARRAFAAKVVSRLHDGVCVLVVDVVTGRRANVHGDIVRLLRARDHFRPLLADGLSAVTYRPVIRNQVAQLDVWAEEFAIGDSLPTMPLRLIADCFVPIDLESTYTDFCRRRRLI